MAAPLKKVLVFPGTTLVGLEILDSLQDLPGFIVHGAGVDVQTGLEAGYSQYAYLPYLDHKDFASELRSLVHGDSVDYIYPANDLAIAALSHLDFPGSVIVSHSPETIRVTGSKIATHSLFTEDQITPRRFVAKPEESVFPLFSKPDVGHSSIDARPIKSEAVLDELLSADKDFWGTHLVTELLTGEEVTVDCFSTTHQGLLYAAPRTRDLAEGGVSVVTTDYADEELEEMAKVIATRVAFNGPWFFQAKRDASGVFRLMEIGARLAGASGIRRAQGVNLAQLAILTASEMPISVYRTRFAFTSRRIDGIPVVESQEPFSALYVDLDDTLILNGAVNPAVKDLVLYVKSLGLYVAVITRHQMDPRATLQDFSLGGVFDDVFHARSGEPKYSYIRDDCNAVLIDDSFSERISCDSKRNVLAVDASSAKQLRRLFDGNR